MDLTLLLVVILILVLIWRGPKTLPQLGRSLGNGIRNARREASNFRSERNRPTDDDQPPT
ncbi:MAG TPA: twin-arginine translocase TatA/TatE family subunit [Candidatus Acidoferrum sp.]|nr:twin-arginine translocase TatA/TatE family subunit [Candidatus Acidoferrum sp.]